MQYICINDIHVDAERQREVGNIYIYISAKIAKTYHPYGLCHLAQKKNIRIKSSPNIPELTTEVSTTNHMVSTRSLLQTATGPSI